MTPLPQGSDPAFPSWWRRDQVREGTSRGPDGHSCAQSWARTSLVQAERKPFERTYRDTSDEQCKNSSGEGFVSCPTTFHDPVFRVPTSEERMRLARQLGEEPPVVVAFEADAGGREPISCLVAAERFEVVHETVLRYWREDTAPGQRFAPWVRPPA